MIKDKPEGLGFSPWAALLSATALAAAAWSGQTVETAELRPGFLEPLYASIAPRLDGFLDDNVWVDAARRPAATAKEFTYRGTESPLLAQEQTIVYVAYDRDFLYFGIRCDVQDPAALRARILRRDANLWYDDSVEVFLDTFHDRKSAYYFAVNPRNVQMDGYFSEEGEVENRNWDGIWYSATRVNDDSWTAELKIPFRSIRFDPGAEEWGVNFVRFHRSSDDQTVWVDMGENLLRVSRFGAMAAPAKMDKSAALDVQPYVSGSYRDLSKDPGDEWWHKEGLDVSARVLPSMTVAATYNPDFAQVEADPYRINLTDEELFYPEKRPFFLEGQEYFDTPIQAFYSRRVGDIYYGGKFLGRAGPTHLYALFLDAKEYTKDPENPDGPHRYDFLVGRVKQDLTKYASVGLLGSRRTGPTWKNNDVVSGDATVSFNDEVIFSGQFLRAMDGETGAADNGLNLSLDRYTSGLSLGVGFSDLGRRLDILKTGYIPYDDVRGLNAFADYNLWMYRWGIKKLNWYVEGERYHNHPGMEFVQPFVDPRRRRLEREGINGEFGVYLENRLTFRALAEANYRQETFKQLYEPPPLEPPFAFGYRADFDNRYYALTAGYNLEEWSSVYCFYEWGTHYDFNLDYFGGGVSFNPLTQLTLAYDADYETLRYRYEPYPYYEFIINRLHADLNLTDELAARFFVQTNSDLGHYATNALLSYEYKKGCHVYLVYNEKRLFKDHMRAEAGRGLIDQLIFLKINYILGI